MMGVKSRAAAAILVLLLLLGTLWLCEYVPITVREPVWFLFGTMTPFINGLSFKPDGSLDSHWESCFKGYNQLNKKQQTSNSSRSDVEEASLLLSRCPGQTFQVSLLLSHLLAASAQDSDVLLQPYLSSWDELVKFMESLGPMVGLISKEIETKTTIIRQLALWSDEKLEAEVGSKGRLKNSVDPQPHSDEYRSVRSMITVELNQGLVDFHHQTDSGCRTILRLHRALLWLQLFLRKLSETPDGGRLRSPSELCREAYQTTLAMHHTWFVRRAAEVAFIAMPERGFFFRLVCAHNQEELSSVLSRVVKAIGVVYDRTQRALEENNMLDLP